MAKAPSSILLFAEAEKRGYQPVWKTDYGFFTFLYQGKTIYIYQTKNYGNNQLLTWLTSDKYATRVILQDANLSNIPFFYSSNKQDLLHFFDEHHPLIAKPVIGELSKNVLLIKEKAQLNAISISETIFEKYIPGSEFRILLLDGKVAAIQKKELNSDKDHPWKKKRINLGKENWDKEKVQLAMKIHQLTPQMILAVDLIEDREGKNWILELNSMPGLWSLSNPHIGEPIHLAPKVLDIIIESQKY